MIATERDDSTDDIAQIALDCDNLQIGENILSVDVFENNFIMRTVATVFKTLAGFSFKFFDKTVNTPATYIIILNVFEKCSNLKLLSS